MLLALLTLTIPAQSFFNVGPFLRENWKKVVVPSFLSIVGFKVLLGKSSYHGCSHCSHCYYQKPNRSLLGRVNSGLDTALNVSTKAGFLLGALYVYNRFFPNQRILGRITEAREMITNHVTEKVSQATDYLHNKIGDLKNNISGRLDKTDGKLDGIQETVTDTQKIINHIDNKISDIQETTQDTNNMLKQPEKKGWFFRLINSD